ncbi:MAG: ADP-ribose pyrophosphatase, partial [Hyphomicrobiaceae bacterium]
MSDDGTFRRLDREVLVDNAWHRYCRDRYVQRDGSEGTYYYVDMAGSCASIPVFDDGTMTLIRVHRYLLGIDLWEFPIGGMKPGDQPLDVAKAELREEAGLAAEQWTPLGHFAPYKGVSNERCHFFLARQLQEVPQELEPSEAISVHRMPIAEARDTLLGQECGDG